MPKISLQKICYSKVLFSKQYFLQTSLQEQSIFNKYFSIFLIKLPLLLSGHGLIIGYWSINDTILMISILLFPTPVAWKVPERGARLQQYADL